MRHSLRLLLLRGQGAPGSQPRGLLLALVLALSVVIPSSAVVSVTAVPGIATGSTRVSSPAVGASSATPVGDGRAVRHSPSVPVLAAKHAGASSFYRSAGAVLASRHANPVLEVSGAAVAWMRLQRMALIEVGRGRGPPVSA